MQEFTLAISDPPHGQIDLQKAAPALGLAPADLRMKTTYRVPEIWLADPDRGQVEPGAVTLREAGLNVDDEILALGGYRVTPQTFADRLHQYAPGDRIEVMIARRDAVRVVPITLAESPQESWRLEFDPDAGEQAIASRNLWLGRSPGSE